VTAVDVGVVGGGIVGLSTAYALTELGATVRVYESGVPGDGQSGGESRIFRHAHDDARLVALARASRAIWAEWASRAGTELVSTDGAVAIGLAVNKRLAVLDEVGGVPVGYRHCWVTRVPWSDDGFAAWQRDGLVFLAGHNLFKQAPAIGRAVARLAVGEQPEVDVAPECRLGAGS
jgi:glycine/D-amino acid oxidase-like deaminating enzyme